MGNTNNKVSTQVTPCQMLCNSLITFIEYQTLHDLIQCPLHHAVHLLGVLYLPRHPDEGNHQLGIWMRSQRIEQDRLVQSVTFSQLPLHMIAFHGTLKMSLGYAYQHFHGNILRIFPLHDLLHYLDRPFLLDGRMTHKELVDERLGTQPLSFG